MANVNELKQATATRDVLITRIFDAPRKLVWQAWTEPEHVMRWWGPKDFTSPVCKIDLRIGGQYHFCMRDQNGQDYWSKGVYLEIIPMTKIMATDSFSDAEGNTIPASQYGLPEDWPNELLVTMTFEDLDGKTKLTIRHQGIPDGQMKEMTSAGWNESLDKLADMLR